MSDKRCYVCLTINIAYETRCSYLYAMRRAYRRLVFALRAYERKSQQSAAVHVAVCVCVRAC